MCRPEPPEMLPRYITGGAAAVRGPAAVGRRLRAGSSGSRCRCVQQHRGESRWFQPHKLRGCRRYRTDPVGTDGRISRAGPWWLRHRRGCQGLCRPKETGTGRGRWLGGDLPSGITECAAAWLGSRGRPSQNGSLAAQRPRYRGQSLMPKISIVRGGCPSAVGFFNLFYFIVFLSSASCAGAPWGRITRGEGTAGIAAAMSTPFHIKQGSVT